MIKQIVRPAAFRLTEPNPLGLRDRPRAEADRQVDYDNEFDFKTLWYDVFQIDYGKAIMVQAPPPLNLGTWFSKAEVRTGGGVALPFSFAPADRNMSMTIHTKGIAVPSITISGPGLSVSTEVSPSHKNWFAGCRVLLGKSQDNSLDWLHDWAKYYIRRHRADAILLYDHGSKKYSMDQILEAVSAAGEVRTVVVVDWNFPFGPPGVGDRLWDSDFCQYGILEHARWRFLSDARSVLSVDVDELVVTPQGKTVFNYCEVSPSGYLRIPAHWVYWCHDGHSPLAREGRLRHLNHRHRKKNEPPSFFKWAVCPRRLAPSSQWAVHAVYNAKGYSCPEVSIKHCYSLTNLPYKSLRASGITTSLESYELDAQFCAETAPIFTNSAAADITAPVNSCPA
jgi:hypothetical protein